MTFRPFDLALMLDNRRSHVGERRSNNGRALRTGYLGTFFNINYSRSLSEKTSVELSFSDTGSTLDPYAATRVTLGVQVRDDANFNNVFEVNLRVSGDWDVCTSGYGPTSQRKGTPLGLAPTQRCDPTSDGAIDYRSFNPGVSELVYFSGTVLEPTRSGQQTSYEIPLDALYRAYPWRWPGQNPRIVGIYFGIEHYTGARTHLRLHKFRITGSGPSAVQREVLHRMGLDLGTKQAPAKTQGILDIASPKEGNFRLRGWACTVGREGPTRIRVQAKRRGASGNGVYVSDIVTFGSTSYSNQACKNGGRNVFDTTIPASRVRRFVGQQVVLLARNSATGKLEDIPTPNWMTFRLNTAPPPPPPPKPTPTTAKVTGLLDLAQPTSDGRFRLRGWACTVGATGGSEVHIRAKSPGSPGIGQWVQTIFTGGSTSYSNGACQNNGNNVFDVTVSRAKIAAFLGQQVVIVARNKANPSVYATIPTYTSMTFR